MLQRAGSYEEVCRNFRWEIPQKYNIGFDICDKWAHQRYRLALIFEDGSGQVHHYTFWDLKRLSDRLANGLRAQGVERTDRVGILLGQCPETAISHIAVYKLGAIAIPLATLFGADALEYRLSNSEAKVVITDDENLEKVLGIRDKLPNLELVLVIKGEGPEGVRNFWELLEGAPYGFEPAETSSEDPAMIIYTSGTTGPPKGALHAHRVLLGHLPGVEFPHNFFPQEDDLFWTPADWAWAGGLLDVLLPSLHHGIPVLAYRTRKFDPEEAFYIIAKHGVRNAFLPPTALKLMRQVKDPRSRYDFQMRSIGSGGETLGEELLSWGREVMGVTINEFYGQTEVNLVVGNCWEVMEIRPGSMGRRIPGHTVEVVDEQGRVLPPGELGEVAIKAPDPVMFLQYWGNPEATEEKYIGPWCLTGDLARKDEDGYFWFMGRKDDVITSAGYRIGPSEIEECILKHPAVSLVAVVGSPDPVRTEVVKAFVVLKPDVEPSPEIEDEIKQFVKKRLAAHEYPREIEFVNELPMTTTGKIKRRELKELEIMRKKGKMKV